jgi:DNA-binding MarR family transcriptional regulator
LKRRVTRAARRSVPAGDGLALSVWLRLLKAHGLLLREARRSVPEGLTLPQFDVLAQLHRRPEGMTSKQLTRELLVTAGNVTGIVERLVGLGLVARRPVPEDRRTLRLVLLPRGREAMKRALPRHRRSLARRLSAVASADLLRLREGLGLLVRALEVP